MAAECLDSYLDYDTSEYVMTVTPTNQNNPLYYRRALGLWIEWRRTEVGRSREELADVLALTLSGYRLVEVGETPTLDHYWIALDEVGLDVCQVCSFCRVIVRSVEALETSLGRQLSAEEWEVEARKYYQEGGSFKGPTSKNTPELYRFALGWLIRQLFEAAGISQATMAVDIGVAYRNKKFTQPGFRNIIIGKTPTFDLYWLSYDRLGKDAVTALFMARVMVRQMQERIADVGRPLSPHEMSAICSEYYLNWRK